VSPERSRVEWQFGERGGWWRGVMGKRRERAEQDANYEGGF